jgi:hypothetical protein
MQGAPEGKQGPLSRTCHIGFTRDKLDEGSPSRATYQVTRYGRLSEPRPTGTLRPTQAGALRGLPSVSSRQARRLAGIMTRSRSMWSSR